MKKVVYTLLAFTPTFAFAANFTAISQLVTEAGRIVAQLIPIMVGLAIVYFFWGVITFIRGAGDAKKTAEGKGIMIYGVIGIAVMLSIWGLVQWLQSSLGITSPTTLPLPIVPGL